MKLADNDKRRVTINKFSGKWFVNVREYYEDKAGDMKPGKKVRAVDILAVVSEPLLTLRFRVSPSLLSSTSPSLASCRPSTSSCARTAWLSMVM